MTKHKFKVYKVHGTESQQMYSEKETSKEIKCLYFIKYSSGNPKQICMGFQTMHSSNHSKWCLTISTHLAENGNVYG